jgi:hypothetical protein
VRLDANALEHSIFQVTSAETADRTFGTCFAVGRRGDDVRLATCAHVVRDVGAERLRVAGAPARVATMGDPEGPDDVALVDAHVPDARPLALGAQARPGDACVVWGFTAVVDNPYAGAKLASLDEFRPIAGRVVTSIRLVAGGRRAVPAD